MDITIGLDRYGLERYGKVIYTTDGLLPSHMLTGNRVDNWKTVLASQNTNR